MHETDPFSPGSAASQWATRSRLKTQKGYARWLGWLSQRGLRVEDMPADRVSQDSVRAYIHELGEQNSSFTILCRVQELYDAIRVIAPDRDWAWLRRVQNNLRSRASRFATSGRGSSPRANSRDLASG